MKYRVRVKEIWTQNYIVEANSKAHAKKLIEASRGQVSTTIQKENIRAQYWGIVGPETWEVEEV